MSKHEEYELTVATKTDDKGRVSPPQRLSLGNRSFTQPLHQSTVAMKNDEKGGTSPPSRLSTGNRSLTHPIHQSAIPMYSSFPPTRIEQQQHYHHHQNLYQNQQQYQPYGYSHPIYNQNMYAYHDYSSNYVPYLVGNVAPQYVGASLPSAPLYQQQNSPFFEPTMQQQVPPSSQNTWVKRDSGKNQTPHQQGNSGYQEGKGKHKNSKKKKKKKKNRPNNKEHKDDDKLWRGIRNCKNLEELLNLQHNSYDEILLFHLSFFWNQASTFVNEREECQKIIRNPGILKPLVVQTLAFREQITDPRYLAVTAHAIAKISFRTRKPIVDSSTIWRVLETNILKAAKTTNFTPKDTASILWSFAKIDRKSDALFNVMKDQVLSNLHMFNCQSIANTVWAYATVGHPAPALFATVSSSAIKKLDTFIAQNLANTVWAYATAGHSAPKLFDEISKMSIKKLDTFNSQAIGNTVWAFATAGHSVPELFDAISKISIKQLDTFNSQAIGNTVWAYATASHPAPELFDAVAHVAIKKLHTFKSQEIANTLWAYAKAGHLAWGLFNAISKIPIYQLDRFTSQNISNTVWAYARAGHPASALFDVVAQLIIKKIDTFDCQKIANTVWAYATAGHLSPELFKEISVPAIKQIDTFNSQNIANTVWAYATAGHSAPELFSAASRPAIKKLDTFTAQNITNTAWAYATVGYDVNPELLDAILLEATQRREILRIEYIVIILWSMAVLDYKQIDAVIPLFSEISKRYYQQDSDENTFSRLSEEALLQYQLHQASLWYSDEHNKESLLPSELRNELSSNFSWNRITTSKLQQNVTEILRSLEYLNPDIATIEEECRCDWTGYTIDIVIKMKNCGKEIAIEVDGPFHFIGILPNGATILKRRQLCSLGGRPLLSIPYWEWDELNYDKSNEDGQTENEEDDYSSIKRKQLYMEQLLRKSFFL